MVSKLLISLHTLIAKISLLQCRESKQNVVSCTFAYGEIQINTGEFKYFLRKKDNSCFFKECIFQLLYVPAQAAHNTNLL